MDERVTSFCVIERFSLLFVVFVFFFFFVEVCFAPFNIIGNVSDVYFVKGFENINVEICAKFWTDWKLYRFRTYHL